MNGRTACPGLFPDPVRTRLAALILALCWLLLCTGPLCAQQAASIVERTAHYSIEFEAQSSAPEGDARELGVVLEQAWKGYAQLMRCEPPLSPSAPFRVCVLANRDNWLSALAAVGITPGDAVDYLYFDPLSSTVFLYRQPSRWFTRRLALHGCLQQFHCRAKSKHADLVNAWYVLGLAEQVSQHRWDGKTLELAAHPRITVIDLPWQAARMLDGGLGLDTFAEAGLHRPALSWSLVTFLREGKGSKYRARFDKLALGQTGSKLSGAEFASSMGKAETIFAELQAWLASVQEPLQSICGEFEDLDGRTLWGRAGGEDFAFAIVRADCQELEARISCEPDSAAGLLLEFIDKQHYTFATLSPRGLRVQRCDGAQLVTLGEYQATPNKDGSQVLRASRSEGRVTLFVEQRETASFALGGSRLGFAVEQGAARFVDLRWK
jgi:hypothetical protein